MCIKFEDKIQGLWLLGTLPDSWETFRKSLSNSTANGVITMELAKGSILNEEMRRKSQGSSLHSNVLVTESRGRSQSKGHTVRYRRKLKMENKKANYNNQKNSHKKDDGGNDSAEANTTADEFFICCDYDMVNVAHDDSSWVVDSGATYNEGEYIDPFDAYCREKGIRHQKSPPKTPQLYGLTKRMNKTLVDRVRCLLSHAGLPNSFWGEALNTIVDVINLTPCVPLSFDVPDRVWICKDASYNHQRVLGCKNFVHVLKDERSKLDVKTKPYQTLKDIEKVQTVPQYSDDLTDLDRVPPQHFEPQSGDETQVDEQHENGDIVNPELPIPDMPAFYVLLTDGGDPECYAEAMEYEHKREWVEAMQDEMNSLYEKNTFELVKLPKGKKALKNKWVYKLKIEKHTSRPRYKARLMVKGFSQRKGIDFDEIFSPVVKMSSIRIIPGLAASLDLD
ncbi:hypothetical protein E3N88_32526 [Mikania micrantha]|uniref:Integrase catalytic domain-containing protein n=1 Tax=Mikania micrantha TaxID=192012 RepID=A0A5N6M9A6_9ASTR|nr:hypothetical protein E3N88_32526 [Mikania micrantha]